MTHLPARRLAVRIKRTDRRRHAIAIAMLLALPACADASTLHATPTSLTATLSKARAGDTIRLSEGDYGELTLSNRTFSMPVIIVGEKANVAGMNLRAVDGLRVVGLRFAPNCGSGRYPLIAAQSKNLAFESIKVRGDGKCWSGILVRESSNVVVSDSDFSDLVTGISRLNTSNFTANGNRFRRMTTDGIAGGCGNNILITKNRFSDFRPSPGAHPDAIQFWSTNCKAPQTDIVISENVYERGEGGKDIVAQGAFVARAGTDPRYARVRIVDNVFLGAMYNGINLSGADDSEISGNIVVGYPDQPSWIRVQDVNRVVLRGNKAESYQFPLGVSGVQQKDNSTLRAVKDRGAAILSKRAK